MSDSKTKAPKLFQPLGISRRRELDGAVLASFGRRAFAWLIDFAIVVLMVAIASVPSVVAAGSKSGKYDLHINPFHGWALLSLPAYFGLVTFWGQGRTLGKRWLGIRVVSLTHDHLSLWHSLERSLGYGASMLEGGFGFIQYFTHPNCQTVHDRIAETIVVMETKTPAPADSPETGA